MFAGYLKDVLEEKNRFVVYYKDNVLYAKDIGPYEMVQFTMQGKAKIGPMGKQFHLCSEDRVLVAKIFLKFGDLNYFQMSETKELLSDKEESQPKGVSMFMRNITDDKEWMDK